MAIRTKNLIIITFIFVTNCFAQPSGPYFGEEPPGLTPKVFAPDFISTSDRAVQNAAFSPDGKEFCFAVSGVNWHSIIMITRQIDGKWTEPDTISFCKTGIKSCCPAYSPDGQKLFFISQGRQNYNSADIWVSERIDNDWAEPQRLNEPVNSNSHEWEVCISQNNTLYFSSSRSGGYGSMDVYCSRLIDGEYTTVENLGPPINTSSLDECPAIAADESFLFFNSYRSGGYGGNDLYLSFKNSDGSWTGPKNLGPEINTSQLDIYPVLSPDGKYFFFTRRRSSSINVSRLYWVSIGAVAPDPNGPIENTSSGERFACLSTAIRFADQGDTLILTPGLYQESIHLYDKDLTLRSVDPNDPFYLGGTIIQGDANQPVVTLINSSADCTLAGLTLRAGSVGISGTATQAMIRNCRIMDNINHGLDLYGASPTLSHCLITANGGHGINMQPQSVTTGTGRQTITTEISCQPVIENCIIVHNGDAAIESGEPVIVNSIID